MLIEWGSFFCCWKNGQVGRIALQVWRDRRCWRVGGRRRTARPGRCTGREATHLFSFLSFSSFLAFLNFFFILSRPRRFGRPKAAADRRQPLPASGIVICFLRDVQTRTKKSDENQVQSNKKKHDPSSTLEAPREKKKARFHLDSQKLPESSWKMWGSPAVATRFSRSTLEKDFALEILRLDSP